jgi:predicted MFS family arabinose efflux permease
MRRNDRNYLLVTAGYWAFTVTDGALRMLVVLYFHRLGYSPLEVALLFLFYEFFGIVTNLLGGWLGARIGLDRTMQIGMALQIVALLALTLPDEWLGVAFVMAVQALSGIAKDLNKLSAKASVKSLVAAGDSGRLFRWVALLTGSKNTLKGAGFFIGAALMQALSFRGALLLLAGMLLSVMLVTIWRLPAAVGRMKSGPRFRQLFSRVAAINRLSAARLFLFGSRDVWFVVGLPVFLYEVLHWSFMQVGGFLALWVIGYGLVQAAAPGLLRGGRSRPPGGGAARFWAGLLVLPPAVMALALQQGWPPAPVVIGGLIVYALIFAINSSLHSFLVLAYSDRDAAAMNVGFYYMANAAGRLIGTLVSGWAYQSGGLTACLWWSSGFILVAWLLSRGLPEVDQHNLEQNA